MDMNAILNMEPVMLLKWLSNEFSVDIPKEIVSVEDMDRAAKTLLQLSTQYSYLQTLLSYAKVATREAKRTGDKQYYEDMVDRKEIIQNKVDSIKQNYAAVSRSVTIRIENNQELRMTASGYIKGEST